MLVDPVIKTSVRMTERGGENREGEISRQNPQVLYNYIRLLSEIGLNKGNSPPWFYLRINSYCFLIPEIPDFSYIEK